MFKEQKRLVNKLISSAKSSYYTAKIIEAASDQNQLYNAVNTMVVKPEASLPNGSSLEQLASVFEIFVQAKVKQIQKNLVSDADYVPPGECPCAMGAKLDILLPATEDEVKLLVAKSPSKWCSLDPVPTWMLKADLDCFYQALQTLSTNPCQQELFRQK